MALAGAKDLLSKSIGKPIGFDIASPSIFPRSVFGALERIRTSTRQLLELPPLPVGLREQMERGTRHDLVPPAWQAGVRPTTPAALESRLVQFQPGVGCGGESRTREAGL